MRDDPPNRYEGPDEPQPRFPSDADIALAERLRQRIEERYLGHPAEATQASAAAAH